MMLPKKFACSTTVKHHRLHSDNEGRFPSSSSFSSVGSLTDGCCTVSRPFVFLPHEDVLAHQAALTVDMEDCGMLLLVQRFEAQAGARCYQQRLTPYGPFKIEKGDASAGWGCSK